MLVLINEQQLEKADWILLSTNNLPLILEFLEGQVNQFLQGDPRIKNETCINNKANDEVVIKEQTKSSNF